MGHALASALLKTVCKVRVCFRYIKLYFFPSENLNLNNRPSGCNLQLCTEEIVYTEQQLINGQHQLHLGKINMLSYSKLPVELRWNL